jgi:hypothetical protein
VHVSVKALGLDEFSHNYKKWLKSKVAGTKEEIHHIYVLKPTAG